MPVLERLVATRIVATPASLDAAVWPLGALALRLAPDEVLVTAEVAADAIADAHAIVERETGFASVWIDRAPALDALERTCEWELPRAQNMFVQGAVAGLPVKLWFEADRVLFIVPAVFAVDFEERLR